MKEVGCFYCGVAGPRSLFAVREKRFVCLEATQCGERMQGFLSTYLKTLTDTELDEYKKLAVLDREEPFNGE